MSEVVTFPTKPGLDDMIAEDLAFPVETPDHASAFRHLEDEICDLTLMADIASALASELLNKPNLPREADRLIFTVQQLANMIGEFKKRYHC